MNFIVTSIHINQSLLYIFHCKFSNAVVCYRCGSRVKKRPRRPGTSMATSIFSDRTSMSNLMKSGPGETLGQRKKIIYNIIFLDLPRFYLNVHFVVLLFISW